MTQAAPLQTSNAKPKQSDSTGLLLQRKCACGSNGPALTGECEGCGKNRRLGMQRKLAVNEPGDKYEQEADRIADTVMRMPFPAVQRQATGEEEGEELLQTKPLSDQITPLVQRQPILEEEDEEEDEALHTKESGAPAPIVTPGIEASIQVLRQGGGQPLDHTTRAFMEPRFGQDFSQVRVHTGPRAESAAQSANALAFTVGRDFVFAAGQYAPRTFEGQRLLAHELTHALHQRALVSPSPTTMQVQSASNHGRFKKGKRPKGYMAWWLQNRVPRGFRIVTARRVARAKRLLSGEFDLTVGERNMLTKLMGSGGKKAAAATPEIGVTSRVEGKTSHEEAVADNASEAHREDKHVVSEGLEDETRGSGLPAATPSAVPLECQIDGIPTSPTSLTWEKHFSHTKLRPTIKGKQVAAATDAPNELSTGIKKTIIVANFKTKTSQVWLPIDPGNTPLKDLKKITECGSFEKTCKDKLSKLKAEAKKKDATLAGPLTVRFPDICGEDTETDVESASHCETAAKRCVDELRLLEFDLLEHEKGHFWISCHVAQQVNEKLPVGTSASIKDLNKARKITNKVQHNIYDPETEHGCNPSNRFWSERDIKERVKKELT